MGINITRVWKEISQLRHKTLLDDIKLILGFKVKENHYDQLPELRRTL